MGARSRPSIRRDSTISSNGAIGSSPSRRRSTCSPPAGPASTGPGFAHLSRRPARSAAAASRRTRSASCFASSRRSTAMPVEMASAVLEPQGGASWNRC
jgi:hypothetical protein